MKKPGVSTDGIVESIDIYPTLVELAGLPQPKELEGVSFLPMLKNPGHTGKQNAISIYNRGRAEGYTLRNDRYRLIYWRNRKTSEVLQVELYDHRVDSYETNNIAKENPVIVEKLRKEIFEVNR